MNAEMFGISLFSFLVFCTQHQLAFRGGDDLRSELHTRQSLDLNAVIIEERLRQGHACAMR